MRAVLPAFIVLLIAGLCGCHALARKIPHRPPRQEVEQVRHELVKDAYASLLDLDDDPNWKPEVTTYTAQEHKDMRARKLSDWILP